MHCEELFHVSLTFELMFFWAASFSALLAAKLISAPDMMADSCSYGCGRVSQDSYRVY